MKKVAGFALFLLLSCCLLTTVHGEYQPGATDMSKVEQAWVSVGSEPDGTWLDWRDNSGNYMSPVGDQSTTGLCWAFASAHCFESQIKVFDGLSFTDDFSEDSIGDCSVPAGPAHGGNFWKAASYFSAYGPILESCQAWSPWTTDCDLTCPQQDYRLRNLRTIGASTAAIKAALVNGPVVTSLDTDAISPNFDTYNGTYVITTGSSSTTNHSVIIVGYHEGTGDPGYLDGNYWICKNSWGSSWGDSGYFYINYGVANIGNANAQYWEWESSLASRGAELLFEDEAGPGGYITIGTNVLYVCQRLVPTQDGEITQIQWANAGNNFNYTMMIYDNRSVTNLTNPLISQLSGSNIPYGGILTRDLPVPVPVTAGDDVFVAIRLHNPTGYDFPCDLDGTVSNQAFYSTTSISSGYSINTFGDWFIRAVVEPAGPTPTPMPQTPTTDPAGLSILLLALGGLLAFRRKK